MRQFILTLLICLLPNIALAATADIREDLIRDVYHINKDQTFTEEVTKVVTLLTPHGVELGQRDSLTFYPKSERLILKAAYVVQPNGEKIPVPLESMFTRPSAASHNAPGFTNGLTKTVVFPQLKPGSKTVTQWQLQQLKPSQFGFNVVDIPDFSAEVKHEQVMIDAPKSFQLHWGKRGSYKVSDKIIGKKRVIIADIKNQPVHIDENSMVSVADVQPVFVASTLSSWNELGYTYWQEAKRASAVTPQIKALADRIVGKKTGRAAAQALYDWDAKNIQYIAIYLNDTANFVPHMAEEVLENGHGDCKDHVALLQALLSAEGIKSEAVLVNWDRSYKPLPSPTALQFNHVMIYLPQFNLYANPTSSYANFGELGSELSNKFVLLASDNPRTAYTPEGSPKHNLYELSNKMKLQKNGEIKGEGKLHFHGSTNESMRGILSATQSLKQLAKQLLEMTPAGGYGDINSKHPANINRNLVLTTKWQSPFAIEMGKKIYFSIPFGIDFRMPQSLRTYLTPKDRKYPLAIRAQTMRWHYDLEIPLEYSVVHLPKNIDFKNQAGEYHSHYQQAGHVLKVDRELVLNHDVYSAKQYPAFKELVYKPINDVRGIVELHRRWF